MMNEEEVRNLIEAARRGDSSAEANLIEAHAGLVRRIVRRYDKGPCRLPPEDLCQEGALGLLLAVRRFDPSRGAAFSTFATWCILSCIQRAIRRQPAFLQWQEWDGESRCRPGDALAYDPFDEPNSPRPLPELSSILGLLPERERRVLSLLYGLEDGIVRGRRETAELCGCSPSTVGLLKRQAILRLRRRFKRGVRSQESGVRSQESGVGKKAAA